MEVQSLGVDCESDISYIGSLVYEYLRDNIPNGDQLPSNSTDLEPVCNGKKQCN